MNAIENILDLLKLDVKNLEEDYKRLLKDGSYRKRYPYSEEGISDALEAIAHKAFELKVCNRCPNFRDCDHFLICMDSIDGSADMAKEYGDRCYNALLRRLGD